MVLERLFRRRARPPVPLVLYTRPGCHLCEVMKAEIARARLGPHELREVDIRSDPALAREHGTSIPVLAICGRIAFRGRLEAADLEREFARAARRWRADEGR